MKLIQRTALLILFVALFTGFGQAQISFGFIGGAANYQGDIAKDITNMKENHIAIGGGLGYRINPYIDVKAQVILTKLSGDDANYPDDQARATRLFKFESNILEVAGIVDYSIFGGGTESKTGVYNPKLSPIVYTGIGIIKIDNNAECYSEACKSGAILNPFPEKDNDVSVLLTIPIGVGLKYDATRLLSFGVRGGYRYSFSDYLDGISQAANAGKNDWYFVLGANVTFYLQPRKDGF